MALFIRIAETGVSKEGGWLLRIVCQWQGIIFTHREEWPVTLSSPLTHNDKKALQWYFDEFSSISPFELGRAKDAVQTMETVAEAATQLIRSITTLQRPLHNASRIVIELQFSPTESSLAELPWEAIENYSYWHGAVRSNASISVVRRVTGNTEAGFQSQTKHTSKSTMRILLISSRSLSSRDIFPDLLTLPIVGLAETLPVERKPELYFARPATWANICTLLDQHGPGFFDIVHFDVHGLYIVNNEENKRNMYLQLSVPTTGGNRGLVGCQVIASKLGEAKVKVVVSNACQSASLSEGWENNLAAALANQGVRCAVAMSYKISADGAKLFTQFLYNELLNGTETWQATQLARAYMRDNSERLARFGSTVMVQDWVVPVVYTSTSADLNQVTSAHKHASWLTRVEPGGDYPRGRAYDISRIEDLVFNKVCLNRSYRALLLYGPGGIGKSFFLQYLSWWWETARAFSRTFYIDFAEKSWTASDLKILLESPTARNLNANGENPHIKYHGKRHDNGLAALFHRFGNILGRYRANGIAGGDDEARKHLERDSQVKPTRAFILDNIDGINVQTEETRRHPWDLEHKNDFFSQLRETLEPEDFIVLCSRVPNTWSEIEGLGTILKYQLAPPADLGIVTRMLDRLGVLEQYQEPDESIAIQNIGEMLSYNPIALQTATGLMIKHCLTARRTYQLLHEMMFEFKPRMPPDVSPESRRHTPKPPDTKQFHISPKTRIVGDLEKAFNSAKTDPMLLSFLAIIGCCRQLLPPDLAEIEDILTEASSQVEWDHEFRRPSLSTFLLWLESWDLIDSKTKTNTGYIYLNPLIWITLQDIFEGTLDATVALAKAIGYASFVKFTLFRLSTGRLDTMGDLPSDNLEKTSEIFSVTVALLHHTPADSLVGQVIQELSFKSLTFSTTQLIQTFTAMLGPHLTPPHCLYFSALQVLEYFGTRCDEHDNFAQLKAIEGLCNLLIQNDYDAFTKWTSFGLERVKALPPAHFFQPSWMYFDFAFRRFNEVCLRRSGRCFTRNCNSRPLDTQLVDSQSEPCAPIPQNSEYYTPYHVARLDQHMRAVVKAIESYAPLEIVNTIRSHIVASCELLLDDMTTAGDVRKDAHKIRKFFARDFETMPDVIEAYSLLSLICPFSPTLMRFLRNVTTADIGSEKTYGGIIQGLEGQEGNVSANEATLLHTLGAVSALERNDLDGAMEHVRALELLISAEESAMKMKVAFLYAKIYSKKIVALPLGSEERRGMNKKLCEMMAQVLRMIEVSPGLEEQIEDNGALLELGKRVKMIFIDDGVRKEFGLLAWWHWREKKRLNNDSFDGWKGCIGMPNFIA